MKAVKNSITCGRTLGCFFFAIMIIVPVTIFAADDLAKILKDIDSSNWQTRLAAVEKLGDRKDEQSIELLMKVAGMREEYWPVKVKAILLLGESKDPKAVDLLLSIFNDTFQNWECPSIKSYTAIALGNFRGNGKVVDTLINGVSDRELFTREASVQSLGKIGDSRAVPYLVNILDDRSIAMKLSAIKALEGIGDPRAIPYLQHVAEKETDSQIKHEASDALKNFHPAH
jgi:HEAT repeat protein